MAGKNRTAFASAERTASSNGVDMTNRNNIGCHMIINMTVISSEGTVTLDSGESDKADATIQLASAQALVASTATIQFNTALANEFSTATAQCTSVVGADFADGTVVCASVIEGDTVIANGLIYTAVNGTKADDTEFDMSGSDDATATDLALSITDDSRSGDVDDVTAAAVTDTVTITSVTRGTAQNSIPLSSSDGTRLAVSGAFLTGGLDGDTVTINGLLYTAVAGTKDDDTQFSSDTGDNETAADLEASVDADVRSGVLGIVSANASTDTVTLTSDQAGTAGDATTLAETGTTITISGATFSGGVDADLIVVNGLTYTAVAGSKGGDNTLFSIDTSNDATATDFADSVTNDSRSGVLDDVTGSATTDTVTATQTVAGVGGNATTLTSTGGGRVILSGATFANGTDADTVTVNGLVYTAVAGAKSDDTEFSIDTSDDAAATDLADSIDDDVRSGVLNDLTATAATDTVTAVTTIGGTVGNATTLASSDEAGRLTISGSTFTGGLDNALVSGITCDGVQIMSGTEIFVTDLATTATNIAANITAFTSTPNYNAVAVGAIIEIESEVGGDTFVVVSSSAVIATTDGNLAANEITFTLQGKDALSGEYYTILASAVVDSVETRVLRVHPSFTAASNTVAKDGLPETYRVIAAHADDSPVTYSVAINLL